MKQLQQGNKTLQKGFTLIELMIVVAVIGVLAAIAMPQYQKYVAKSEVASVLATLTGIKTNVEAYAVSYGEFPAAGTEANLGIPSSISLGAAAFSPDATTSGATGSIVFTFKDVPDASNLTATQNLTLERNADGGWTCTSTNIKKSDGILPKNCVGI